MLVAELGELDVAFDASVVRGRKVTLRLHDLPWDKALDVVVRAAGLVLVAEGEGGKRRVVESDAKGETARRSPARDACAADPALRVTAVLFRPRGGKSLAVIDGEKFLEGEEKPLAADASGKTARVRLEKVREDGSAIISVDGERRVVNPGTGFGSGR